MPMTSPSCQHLQNVKLLLCPCLVRVKHQVSIIPIFLYFLQVPWPTGNNVCSPCQNFCLQLAFPPYNSYTLCVPDNTIIKVIHKHNIRTVLLPLVVWGVLKLLWTFSISLPAFSPNPSNDSSRYPCVHDSPSTVVSALLVTCFNNISYNFHALRMNSFMLGGGTMYFVLYTNTN